jgi:hypothetical protein
LGDALASISDGWPASVPSAFSFTRTTSEIFSLGETPGSAAQVFNRARNASTALRSILAVS